MINTTPFVDPEPEAAAFLRRFLALNNHRSKFRDAIKDAYQDELNNNPDELPGSIRGSSEFSQTMIAIHILATTEGFKREDTSQQVRYACHYDQSVTRITFKTGRLHGSHCYFLARNGSETQNSGENQGQPVSPYQLEMFKIVEPDSGPLCRTVTFLADPRRVWRGKERIIELKIYAIYHKSDEHKSRLYFEAYELLGTFELIKVVRPSQTNRPSPVNVTPQLKLKKKKRSS